MEALKVENLYLKFSKEYYILYNINLSLNKGEKLLILAEKESGKTALLRSICGLENIDEGNIYINNTELKKFDFGGKYQVGFLPTYPVFFDAKTVRYNLEYVLKIRKVDVTLINTKINDILDKFELNRLADKAIYSLTKFEKFLVSIARLYLRNLDMLLIDTFEDIYTYEECEVINKFLIPLFRPETLVIKSTEKQFDMYKDFKVIKLNNGSIVKDKAKKTPVK